MTNEKLETVIKNLRSTYEKLNQKSGTQFVNIIKNLSEAVIEPFEGEEFDLNPKDLPEDLTGVNTVLCPHCKKGIKVSKYP